MCLLAIEVRMSITFYLMNKEGFVRGVRYTILAVTLFVALAAFITVCLLRHDEGFRTFSTLSNGKLVSYSIIWTSICICLLMYHAANCLTNTHITSLFECLLGACIIKIGRPLEEGIEIESRVELKVFPIKQKVCWIEKCLRKKSWWL